MANQPAKQLLQQRGFTVNGVARRYGIDPLHLYNALVGRVKPSHEVRVALTDLLRLPVTELFTADALAQPFQLRRTSAVVASARRTQ